MSEQKFIDRVMSLPGAHPGNLCGKQLAPGFRKATITGRAPGVRHPLRDDVRKRASRSRSAFIVAFSVRTSMMEI
jgi:hypothetical protein